VPGGATERDFTVYKSGKLSQNGARAVFAAKEPRFFSLGEVRVMIELIPMTRTGYDKIKAELAHLEQVEMPAIVTRMATARKEGDLGENAEYHGARESQGLLQAKINVLRDKLARAALVDPSKLPRDEVVFGATVVVKDLDFGDEEIFVLVGAGEEDYDAGKILVTSPLAQGLLGKKPGDKVEITVPKGTMSFEILEIRFED
jgi:transcription elongation factor GreA